jgi:hypothetical protein
MKMHIIILNIESIAILFTLKIIDILIFNNKVNVNNDLWIISFFSLLNLIGAYLLTFNLGNRKSINSKLLLSTKKYMSDYLLIIFNYSIIQLFYIMVLIYFLAISCFFIY